MFKKNKQTKTTKNAPRSLSFFLSGQSSRCKKLISMIGLLSCLHFSRLGKYCVHGVLFHLLFLDGKCLAPTFLPWEKPIHWCSKICCSWCLFHTQCSCLAVNVSFHSLPCLGTYACVNIKIFLGCEMCLTSSRKQ